MAQTSPAAGSDALRREIEKARQSGALTQGHDVSALFEMIAAGTLKGESPSAADIAGLFTGADGRKSEDELERLREKLTALQAQGINLTLPSGGLMLALATPAPALGAVKALPKKSMVSALPKDVWYIGGAALLLLSALAIWQGGAKDSTSALGGTSPSTDTHVAQGKLTEKPDDIALGSPAAPVQIVEYASITCSHCAAFAVGNAEAHKEAIFPQIRAKYIDTGKVRYIFREFPLNGIDVAGFMAMRCAVGANAERYFAAADLLFSNQKSWAFSSQDGNQIINNLAGMMKQTGLGRAEFDACLKNEAALARLQAGQKEATESFHISSTPTLIINGVTYQGELEFSRFEAILAPLLPKG